VPQLPTVRCRGRDDALSAPVETLFPPIRAQRRLLAEVTGALCTPKSGSSALRFRNISEVLRIPVIARCAIRNAASAKVQANNGWPGGTVGLCLRPKWHGRVVDLPEFNEAQAS
jgi:hypothetical protein